MSSDASTNLQLPYLMPAQAQKHVTVNESLRRLDALVQCGVVSRSVAFQPASPQDGQVYIAPPGKTGAAWDAFTNNALAYYRDGAWVQIHPREGWRVWVSDEARLLVYRNGEWVDPPGAASGAANLLVNGGFDLWQRGAGFAIPASYFTFVADRWQALRGGAALGLTVSRVAGEAGSGAYALKLQRDAGDTSAQPIYLVTTLPNELCHGLASGSVALSVRARKGANHAGDVVITVYGGTGADQNSIAGLTGQAVVAQLALGLTTSNQTFTATGSVGASATQLAVQIVWTPSGTAGADDSVTLEFVKLERGAVATPYVAPDPTHELARCQRYYRTLTHELAGAFVNATGFTYFAQFPEMRVAPTVTQLSTTPEAHLPSVAFLTSTGNTGAPAQVRKTSLQGTINGFTGRTAGEAVHVVSPEPYLALSAEL